MIYFFNKLDKYLKHKGLNDNQITLKANLSNGIIGKGRKRGSLSMDNIAKILHSCKDLNANWLFSDSMSDSEEMLNPTNTETTKQHLDLTKDKRFEVLSGTPERSLEYYENFIQEQQNVIIEAQQNNKLLIKQGLENSKTMEKLVIMVTKYKEELEALKSLKNSQNKTG